MPMTRTPYDKVKVMAGAAQRKLIEAQARPGETFDQASARYFKELEGSSMKTAHPSRPRPTMRPVPVNDEQPDLFVPNVLDIATKDSRSLMDVAVFRLSKRDKRPNATLRHELADGYIEVKGGPDGMATVWDYDIILMAISYLTEAINRYRDGRGEKPARILQPNIVEILKFCRRSDGGRQYEEIEAALDRLKNTSLKIVRNRRGRGGRMMRVVEGEGLLSNYRVSSYAQNGSVASVELEVPNWIYREVVESKQPEILTVHPDYFLIEPGIGRYLYRLARRVAGRGQARWSFKLVYERSGSAGSFKEFCRMLRRLIMADQLPEYRLNEVQGKAGPMLVITNRDATPADLSNVED